jgi:hypothetical protein
MSATPTTTTTAPHGAIVQYAKRICYQVPRQRIDATLAPLGYRFEGEHPASRARTYRGHGLLLLVAFGGPLDLAHLFSFRMATESAWTKA